LQDQFTGFPTGSIPNGVFGQTLCPAICSQFGLEPHIAKILAASISLRVRTVVPSMRLPDRCGGPIRDPKRSGKVLDGMRSSQVDSEGKLMCTKNRSLTARLTLPWWPPTLIFPQPARRVNLKRPCLGLFPRLFLWIFPVRRLGSRLGLEGPRRRALTLRTLQTYTEHVLSRRKACLNRSSLCRDRCAFSSSVPTQLKVTS